MTSYSISFNGLLDASEGTIMPGTCVCMNTAGTAFVPSTTGNRGDQRTSGMVTFTSYGGKAISIQTDGIADRSITQIPYLAGAESTAIRVNAGGTLERANPILAGDEIVGSCNQWGDAILAFGQSSSALIGDLAGDVVGPPGVNVVEAIQGIAVAAGAPSVGQVLTATSSSTAAWSSATPVVTLNGNVTGASDSNTVVKIHDATVPAAGALTTGNVLQVSGASALSYGPVNLAGGSNYVTGILPAGNIPNEAGDVTGDIAANRVTSISGTTGIPTGTVTMTSGVHLDFAGGSLSDASGGLKWTGTGFSLVPSTNQALLAGSISASSSGLWIGSNTSAPTVNNAAVLMASGVTTIRGDTSIGLTSSSGFVTLSTPILEFNFGITNPVITQLSTASSANILTVKGQNCSNTNSSGGDLFLIGGTGTGTAKVAGVRVNLGDSTIMMQATDTSTSGANRVLALLAGTPTTSGILSSGDMVAYVANAVTAPTAGPSAGVTVFSEGDALKYVDPTGFVVTL